MRPAAFGLLTIWVLLTAHAALGEEVQFATDDGFTIHADLTRAESEEAPVAILLHMYRSDRHAWKRLTPKLTAAGFHVLALDQRTHGDSTRRGEETIRVEDIPRPRFGAVVRKGVLDVVAGYRFLQKQGLSTENVAMIGASYGCTVSLLAARDLPGINALVLLSPGALYFGVSVLEVVRFYSMPMLVVAAEDDRDAADNARALTEAHKGKKELVVYPSGGHGTRLFDSHPEIIDSMLTFLSSATGLATEEPPPVSETPPPTP
jgi:pimeloyl-ACP methyl ester carboxylesterase